MKHSCEKIYAIGGENKKYGDITGVCRITGKQSIGIPFKKWVKDTFTDLAYLKPGSIISNEAAFCFDEASEQVQKRTGKEKLQRFRTYSHIIKDDEWYCLTKADKQKIFELIISGAELVCLTDTGQKHLLFKHKTGMWQLDEIYVQPNIEKLIEMHTLMCEMMKLGFSQAEIISGKYNQQRIMKVGIADWKKHDDQLKAERGTSFMQFASWMLFIDEESKNKIQESYQKNKKS